MTQMVVLYQQIIIAIKMEKIESTVVVTDIRNFTGLSEEFESRDSNTFMKFMEKYNEIHMVLAEEIAGKYFYVNTTGDGVLCIFKGDNHQVNGYAFALSMYRTLSKMCKSFSKEYSVKLNFGIGADSGTVQKIFAQNNDFEIKTYLGPVINRTVRIESSTKEYHITNMIIGGELYKTLIKKIYPNVDTTIFDTDNYDNILESDPELILKSKELLLVYLFEKLLKGVSEPTSIFRLSKTYANKDGYFFRTLIRMIGKYRTRRLIEIGKCYK